MQGQEGLERPTLALVRLLARGRTVSDAAAILGLSRRTATRRLTQARRRLGVRTNAEVVLIATGGCAYGDSAAPTVASTASAVEPTPSFRRRAATRRSTDRLDRYSALAT